MLYDAFSGWNQPVKEEEEEEDDDYGLCSFAPLDEFVEDEEEEDEEENEVCNQDCPSDCDCLYCKEIPRTFTVAEDNDPRNLKPTNQW